MLDLVDTLTARGNNKKVALESFHLALKQISGENEEEASQVKKQLVKQAWVEHMLVAMRRFPSDDILRDLGWEILYYLSFEIAGEGGDDTIKHIVKAAVTALHKFARAKAPTTLCANITSLMYALLLGEIRRGAIIIVSKPNPFRDSLRSSQSQSSLRSWLKILMMLVRTRCCKFLTKKRLPWRRLQLCKQLGRARRGRGVRWDRRKGISL